MRLLSNSRQCSVNAEASGNIAVTWIDESCKKSYNDSSIVKMKGGISVKNQVNEFDVLAAVKVCPKSQKNEEFIDMHGVYSL